MSEIVIIQKLDDWRQRLDAFVKATARTPFVWGEHDCGLFADAGFEAQTGVSLAADLRGRYCTLEEALKLLHEQGFADHVALAAARLPSVHPAFARLGDIAAVDFGTAGMTLTIVSGRHLVGPGLGMRDFVSRSLAVRAFAVGWRPEADQR
jgi:hypothetical protein